MRVEQELLRDAAGLRTELSVTSVVVFGWAGASRRQLGLPRQLHAHAGRQTLMVRPRIPRNMVARDGFASDGRRAADRIAAAFEGRWAAHVFSNAGFWTWDATVMSLRGSDPAAMARCRAVVIDSAPGFPETIDRAFNVRHSAMAMTPMAMSALGMRPSLRHPLVTPVIEAGMTLWHATQHERIAFLGSALSRLAHTTSHIPHLFLYGDSDRLVPFEYVEDFAKRMRAAGASVRCERFEDSGHVQHLLRHRKFYTTAVNEFLATTT